MKMDFLRRLERCLQTEDSQRKKKRDKKKLRKKEREKERKLEVEKIREIEEKLRRMKDEIK